MKKTIFAILILVATQLKAQLYVQVIDKSTLQPSYMPYVPGVTNITGVTSKQLDSTRTAANNFTNTSVNNLQTWTTAQLALKANIGSGGTAEGSIINLPEQTFWKEIRPNNYLQKYSDGTQQGSYKLGAYSSVLSNVGTDRPDAPFVIASYNQNKNGGRELLTDAAWSITVEPHYTIEYPMGASFEPHMFLWTDYNGVGHRAQSGYFSKKTGQGFWAFECNSFSLLGAPLHPGEDPKTYFNIIDAQVNVTAIEEGRTVGYTGTDYYGNTLGIHDTGGQGYIDVPGVMNLNSNDNGKQSLLPNLNTYPDNASAKAAKLVSGNVYWTIVNGQKVLAQVQ